MLKLQSAMEYLMTYGWAILIIAVVLGALFGLGFFNSANLSPKIGAGACQVYRPQGPGTTIFINLEGTCNNELPQYVAQFNGATSFLSMQNSPNLDIPLAITVSAWLYYVPGSLSNQVLVTKADYQNYWLYLGSANTPSASGIFELGLPGRESVTSAATLSQSKWHMITGTYDGNTIKIYLDGVLSATTTATGPITTSSSLLCMGSRSSNPCTGGSNPLNGELADVQIYNTSLSANEVAFLYQEGLGGVPVLLQNLVGWWPLNGNANDYSGNLNNGVSTNVVFTSSWTSGYTAP